jgi:hypothetical protein
MQRSTEHGLGAFKILIGHNCRFSLDSINETASEKMGIIKMDGYAQVKSAISTREIGF